MVENVISKHKQRVNGSVETQNINKYRFPINLYIYNWFPVYDIDMSDILDDSKGACM